MADPVFTTRDELEAWELGEVMSRGPDNRWIDEARLALSIEQFRRVRAAHAHLLTPESDNGTA